MIKFVSVMFYHYLENGPALAVSFDKDFLLTEEEFGRTVKKMQFIDWAESCRNASKRLESAKTALENAEQKRIAATQAADDSDEIDPFSEETKRLKELEKEALAAETEAEEALKNATAEFRACGAHLTGEWK